MSDLHDDAAQNWPGRTPTDRSLDDVANFLRHRNSPAGITVENIVALVSIVDELKRAYANPTCRKVMESEWKDFDYAYEELGVLFRRIMGGEK